MRWKATVYDESDGRLNVWTFGNRETADIVLQNWLQGGEERSWFGLKPVMEYIIVCTSGTPSWYIHGEHPLPPKWTTCPGEASVYSTRELADAALDHVAKVFSTIPPDCLALCEW